MEYTKIPTTAFQNIQLNAGILVDNFVPATGTIGRLLGATSGGVQFTDSVEYTDFGEDIDNCPKNMLELKKLNKHEATLNGTFVTIDATTTKMLAGAADVDDLDATHIIPRNEILVIDFSDIWWIGDYSDQNTGENAGFVAIHLMNALNTGGFQIQSVDKEKGKFAFSFMGHYSMNEQDTVPYEIYIKQGGTVTPAIILNKNAMMLADGAMAVLTATIVPSDADIVWTTSNGSVATVDAADGTNAVVTAAGTGTATITAKITVSTVDYTAECAVTVEE